MGKSDLKIETTTVPIATLVRDPAVNSRAAGESEELAAEYAEALKNGAKFPPPVAFRGPDGLLVGDGFHRCRAFEIAGKTEIEVEVRDGDRRAAILFAVGANANHGARRTRADVQRAIGALLSDPEWREKSDRWLAEKVGVHNETIADARKRLTDSVSSEARTGKDGKKRRPKKGRKPKANGARALRMAQRGFDAIARRWPKGEDVAPLVEAGREWLAGLGSKCKPGLTVSSGVEAPTAGEG